MQELDRPTWVSLLLLSQPIENDVEVDIDRNECAGADSAVLGQPALRAKENDVEAAIGHTEEVEVAGAGLADLGQPALPAQGSDVEAQPCHIDEVISISSDSITYNIR